MEWPPGEGTLYFPVTGNAAPPNSLRARAIGADGAVVREWSHTPVNLELEAKFWELEGSAGVGAARLEVRMVDGSPGHGGWLGIGRVVKTQPGRARFLDPAMLPAFNAAFFVPHVFLIAGFLFLPGLFLRTCRATSRLPAAMLPVPGMAVLMLTGVGLWIIGPDPSRMFAAGLTAVYAVMGVLVIVRRASVFAPLEARGIRLYFALVALLLAWSIVPLTVEREFFEGTNARGRMVASPPDNYIPYFTAAYFLNNRGGEADEERYFGKDWSATSRGPLASLMIATGMRVLGFEPHNPPPYRGPCVAGGQGGVFIARIVGIFTNALVVLGALAALAALARGRRDAIWFGLGWVAVSPVVFINGAFLWPKMLATYFGLLAVAEIAGRSAGQQNSWRTGAWLALSYLAHPVGLLIAAPLLLWRGFVAARGQTGPAHRFMAWARAGATAGIPMILFAAPWLAYKLLQARPDVFLRYPLGDGRGFEAAASFGSWLSCRWDNFVFSLVPGTLWSSNLLVDWAGGSLSVAGHWAMNCAKTLPFGVGLALFPLMVWRFTRPGDRLINSFRIWVLGAGFMTMLLVWGYSRDGLGRSCLEPLVIFAIIATAVCVPRVRLIHRLLLGVVAIETSGLLVSGYVFNPAFLSGDTDPIAWATLAVAGLAWVSLAGLALERSGADTPGDEVH